MNIINQDNDTVILKTKPVRIYKHYYNGHFYGYNLMHDTTLLSTFDRWISAAWQKLRVTLSIKDYVIVGGYCRDDAFESLQDVLFGGVECEADS